MSEEEIKAIETIKEDIEVYKQKGAWKENSILVKSLRIILNLITKQQKEIDSMSEFIWKYDCCEHFKKEDENFKCEGWYINRECRENCIKPHFRKEII